MSESTALAPAEETPLAQVTQRVDANIVEAVITSGDLNQLSPDQRVSYYKAVCESMGLNPLTHPFSYIKLSGGLKLYARREATDQLRRIYGVSTTITDRRTEDDIYIVTALATDKHGRTDESIGAVPLGNTKGEARANAIMRAETKAKRRATLALVGLGWLDETEVESIPDAVLMDSPAVEPQAAPATNGQPTRRPAPQQPRQSATRQAPRRRAAPTTSGLTPEQQAEFEQELAQKSDEIKSKTAPPTPRSFEPLMQWLRLQPNVEPNTDTSTPVEQTADTQAELDDLYAEDAARQEAAQMDAESSKS